MYPPPDQLIIEGRAGIASRWIEAFFVKELQNLIQRRTKGNFFHCLEKELVHRANIYGERVVNNSLREQREALISLAFLIVHSLFTGPFRWITLWITIRGRIWEMC